MDYTKRDFLKLTAGAALVSSPIAAIVGESIKMNFWVEDEATRIAIETLTEHHFTHSVLRFQKPLRLVLDIENMTKTAAIEKAIREIKTDDRYIAGIRVGQFKPTVLRIVFDLKQDVTANVTHVNPVADIGHRIMIEIAGKDYDPLAKLIAETPSETPSKSSVEKKAEKENSAAAKKSQPPTTKKPAKEPQVNPEKKKTFETLIVVVDPGHGGADPGAIGRRRHTYEKDVVLSIAKKLAARINATPGMRALLTRNRDIFIPLHKRAQFAVKNRAHLFVSIHADAWDSPKAKGSSVFTLSVRGASSLQARWLAQTQNESDAIGGTVFRDVGSSAIGTVVDMLAEMKLRYGIELGDAVLEELAKLGPLHKDTVEYAQFAVLKAQGIPSILVETAFISNPSEELKLRNNTHQNRFAEAIFKGIDIAVKRNPSLLKCS